MSKLDQWNYQEMIAEAETLRTHLHEWAEQMDEDGSLEGAAAWDAYRYAEVCCKSLKDASDHNAHKSKVEIERALQRVELGTTTDKDAQILREALK